MQLLSALAAVHENFILHRDLKQACRTPPHPHPSPNPRPHPHSHSHPHTNPNPSPHTHPHSHPNPNPNVKQTNLLLDKNGVLKLCDFGKRVRVRARVRLG